jgi:hypothetical protein
VIGPGRFFRSLMALSVFLAAKSLVTAMTSPSEASDASGTVMPLADAAACRAFRASGAGRPLVWDLSRKPR